MKPWFVSAAAGLLTSSTLIAGSAAPAVADPVPATCSPFASAFTPDGVDAWYSYSQRQASAVVSRYPKLGFEPRAVLEIGGDSSSNARLVVSPSGALIRTIVSWTEKNGTRSYKRTNTTIQSSGFGDVRGLTRDPGAGDNYTRYFYALTEFGLKRLKVNQSYTAVSSVGWVGQKGWHPVKTLSWSHETQTARGTADVLLATRTEGELVEYTIPHNDPTKWTRTQIRPRGWHIFTSLNVGRCNANGTDRSFLGIRRDGAAFVYYDKNRFNGAARDIGPAEKVATNWKLRSYSS